MKFVELHLIESGLPVLVNLDTVEVAFRVRGHLRDGTEVRFQGGGDHARTLGFKETYEQVRSMIAGTL